MTTSDLRGRKRPLRSSPRRNSITAVDERDSESTGPVNAECASTWGDKPTPAGYLFTVS